MPAIAVFQPAKTFQAKCKAAGLGGLIRALFKPEYQTVEAVRGLSFEMDQGGSTAMKKQFILIFALLVASCAPIAAPSLDADRARFADGLIESQRALLDQFPGASVYNIDLEIDADLIHVNGREEVRYTNTESVTLDQVDFRLFPNILGGELAIQSVTVNDRAATLDFDLGDSLMRVPLTLEPGESAGIRIEFTVTAASEVGVNYGILFSDGRVLTLAHAYPLIAVYDASGWNVEIPSPNGDLIYADASFYVVRVTAPQNVTLIASGREIQSQQGDPQVVTLAAGPARDFQLTAAKDYARLSQKTGEVTINSYAPAEFQDRNAFVLEVAVHALEIYSQRYAPYPYTELDLVATPTLALGVEYPGLVVLRSGLYDPDQDGKYPVPATAMLETTVAHEVGHQWFYNLVGNDQLDEPWLDESLAQLATWQYFTDRYGAQAGADFADSLDERWQRVDRERIPIGQPVSAYSPLQYGAIVYGRGPLFFLKLRDEIGSDAFDLFLRNYTATYSWGLASGAGLKASAEQACACDLTPLFNAWIAP
jgi:aminopeptidase N